MREPITDFDHATDEQQLDATTRSLKTLIAAAPQHSHAAATAQRQLDLLERPICRLTTAEKLAVVRAVLHRWKSDRLVDNVLFHPAER